MENREPKYKAGDVVKVINYGHPAWVKKLEHEKMFNSGLAFSNVPKDIIFEQDDIYWYDQIPSIVGKTGTIKHVTDTQGIPKYSIDGIHGKSAWYDEQQLEIYEDGKNI